MLLQKIDWYQMNGFDFLILFYFTALLMKVLLNIISGNVLGVVSLVDRIVPSHYS